jgi:hypothetical protein
MASEETLDRSQGFSKPVAKKDLVPEITRLNIHDALKMWAAVCYSETFSTPKESADKSFSKSIRRSQKLFALLYAGSRAIGCEFDEKRAAEAFGLTAKEISKSVKLASKLKSPSIHKDACDDRKISVNITHPSYYFGTIIEQIVPITTSVDREKLELYCNELLEKDESLIESSCAHVVACAITYLYIKNVMKENVVRFYDYVGITTQALRKCTAKFERMLVQDIHEKC